MDCSKCHYQNTDACGPCRERTKAQKPVENQGIVSWGSEEEYREIVGDKTEARERKNK